MPVSSANQCHTYSNGLYLWYSFYKAKKVSAELFRIFKYSLFLLLLSINIYAAKPIEDIPERAQEHDTHGSTECTQQTDGSVAIQILESEEEPLKVAITPEGGLQKHDSNPLLNEENSLLTPMSSNNDRSANESVDYKKAKAENELHFLTHQKDIDQLHEWIYAKNNLQSCSSKAVSVVTLVFSVPVTLAGTINVLGLAQSGGVFGVLQYLGCLSSVGMMFSASFVEAVEEFRSIKDLKSGLKLIAVTIPSFALGAFSGYADALNAENVGGPMFYANMFAGAFLYAKGGRSIFYRYASNLYHLLTGKLTTSEHGDLVNALTFCRKVIEAKKKCSTSITVTEQEIAAYHSIKNQIYLNPYGTMQFLKQVEVSLKHNYLPERKANYKRRLSALAELASITIPAWFILNNLAQVMMTSTQIDALKLQDYNLTTQEILAMNSSSLPEFTISNEDYRQISLAFASYMVQGISLMPMSIATLQSALYFGIPAAAIFYLYMFDKKKYDRYKKILKGGCHSLKGRLTNAFTITLTALGTGAYNSIIFSTKSMRKVISLISDTVSDNRLRIYIDPKNTITITNLLVATVLFQSNSSYRALMRYVPSCNKPQYKGGLNNLTNITIQDGNGNEKKFTPKRDGSESRKEKSNISKRFKKQRPSRSCRCTIL